MNIIRDRAWAGHIGQLQALLFPEMFQNVSVTSCPMVCTLYKVFSNEATC